MHRRVPPFFFRFGLLATFFACSVDRHVEHRSEPSPSSSKESAKATRVVAALEAFAPFHDRLGRGRRLERTGLGHRLVAQPFAVGEALEAALPVAAGDPLRLSIAGRSADLFLELRASSVSGVGAPIDGAVVFADASRDTDVVQVAEPGRVEELRLLRSPAASPTARYSLRHGPGIAEVRVRERRVEALDFQGVVRFASDPMFAVDARGVRRALDVRLDGAELIAELDVRDLTYPIAVDPSWSLTGSMSVPRVNHSATLLPSGKVLVAGGGDSSAELYDPTAKTWSSAGTMSVVRSGHVATLLPSGKVLVTGNVGSPTSSAELYDPVSNSWGSAGAFTVARNNFHQVPLPDGRQLVVGGRATTGLTPTADLYDPIANSWKSANVMASPRMAPVAMLLSTGKVLVAGGYTYGGGTSTTSTADLYDPGSNSWTPAPPMSSPRDTARAFALPKGILVIGGCSTSTGTTCTPNGTAELYDPVANTWGPPSTLFSARVGFGATLLSTGRVLIVGGSNATPAGAYFSSAEYFDPTFNKWAFAGNMTAARAFPFVTQQDLGAHAVAIGGVNSVSPLAGSELYDPAVNSWKFVGAMSTDRTGASYTEFPSGDRVLVAGGTSTALAGATLSTAEVFSYLASGTSCATAADCRSGFCVDGVCCDSACTGACSACDLAASKGTCTNVASGPPHGSRSCSPYAACSAGACIGTCAADADCAATAYCLGAACTPKKSNGSTCSTTNECASGNCVDGTCCNTACGEQCAACNVGGKEGTCTAVTGRPVGARAACAGVGVGTSCGQACNGSDTAKCNYPPTTAPCSANACASGIETHASTCNGSGVCNDIPKTCGAFTCDVASCKTTCAKNADCAAGFICNSALTCEAAHDLGADCTTSATCSTGFCTDGVCCGVGACGAGSSCANAGKKGTCSKNDGTACVADGECAKEHCVDKVCCESSCSGQCQACDQSGQLGKCTAVVGVPHGARAKCDDGGGDACKVASCDGSKDVSKCAGFPGATTSCGAASCAAGSFVAVGACDGSGACKSATPQACGAYACTTSGCGTKCAADGECAKGFVCSRGACVPQAGATCSPDGLSSMDHDGNATPCGAYRCGSAGTCVETCADSTACAQGYACDGTHCTPPPSTASSSGGCQTGLGGGEYSGALILLALVLSARRRSIRAAR